MLFAMAEPGSLLPAVMRSPRGRVRAAAGRSPLRALCAALQRGAAAAARSRPAPPGVSTAPALQLALQRSAEAALRAAAALAAALALHLGGAQAAQASVAEDALLQLVRQVEAKVDGAVGAVRGAASLVSLQAGGGAASRTGTCAAGMAGCHASPALLLQPPAGQRAAC